MIPVSSTTYIVGVLEGVNKHRPHKIYDIVGISFLEGKIPGGTSRPSGHEVRPVSYPPKMIPAGVAILATGVLLTP